MNKQGEILWDRPIIVLISALSRPLRFFVNSPFPQADTYAVMFSKRFNNHTFVIEWNIHSKVNQIPEEG